MLPAQMFLQNNPNIQQQNQPLNSSNVVEQQLHNHKKQMQNDNHGIEMIPENTDINRALSHSRKFASSVYDMKNRYGSNTTRASKITRPEFIEKVIDDEDFKQPQPTTTHPHAKQPNQIYKHQNSKDSTTASITHQHENDDDDNDKTSDISSNGELEDIPTDEIHKDNLSDDESSINKINSLKTDPITEYSDNSNESNHSGNGSLSNSNNNTHTHTNTNNNSTHTHTTTSSKEWLNIDLDIKRMNNYFSIGIDAELALSFHAARELHPERFNSRLYNKSVYFRAALKKFATLDIPDISSKIRLKIPHTNMHGGQEQRILKIPKGINAIVLLNIPSYAGGRKIWSASGSKFSKCDMADGVLEVVGLAIKDSIKIFTGVGVGTRLAQTESVEIDFMDDMAVQIDGEPWNQPPCKIKISALPNPQIVLSRASKK